MSTFRFCPHCAAALAPRLIDGAERLACTAACGYVCWNNPTPVVAALVQQGEHFILARNAAWPAGMFSLITGFLEAGELPEPAIAREAQEELGLGTASVRFLGHFSLPQFNQLIVAYHLTACGELAPGAEIAETQRLTRAELLAYDFGPLELSTRIVRAALQPAAA